MIHNLARGVQSFTSNVFLVEGAQPALVDVGNDFDVLGAVRDAGLDPEDVERVVLTHTHPDHVGTLEAVREATDAEVLAFDGSFEGVDAELADGGTVTLGDHTHRALHTPGHKNDHICLYSAAASVLFAGDLVFANGSFGRTDLEEGDRDQLVDSIDRVLDTVDESLSAMHTGHGPSVTTDAYRDIELAWQAARF